MRINTMMRLLVAATTGRLQRLAIRLRPSLGSEINPRDGVRLIWLTMIADVIGDRQRDSVSDN